jgi:predicted GH43/DUF377 family glycosyl hydrolase
MGIFMIQNPFQWKKMGLVFQPKLITNRPWLQEFAQAPCTLLFDDFVRVYFSCRPPADENGQYVSYSSYVDFDRKNLFHIRDVAEQPILTLGDVGTFDQFGTYPVSVIRYGDAVRAYYAGWTRCQSVPFNVAIGIAESLDGGTTFTRLGQGPVLSYSLDEPFVMSGPKIRKFNDEWFLYYIAGKKWIMHDGRAEPVYRIRMARSKDGINWVKENRDLISPRIEEDECQASPDVIFHNNRYHMFYCYRYSRDYRSKSGGYRIGYAHSDDAVHWVRDDSRVGIDVADEGWDSEMISYPHIAMIDGRIFMFYLGNSVGRQGFGVAELQGDLI